MLIEYDFTQNRDARETIGTDYWQDPFDGKMVDPDEVEVMKEAGLSSPPDLGPTYFRIENQSFLLKFSSEMQVDLFADLAELNLREDGSAQNLVFRFRSNDSATLIEKTKELFEKLPMAKAFVNDEDDEEEDDQSDDNFDLDLEQEELKPSVALEKWSQRLKDDSNVMLAASSEGRPTKDVAMFQVTLGPVIGLEGFQSLSLMVMFRNAEYDEKDQAKRDKYFENADRFIEMANGMAEDGSIDHVAGAFLYAAARYSSFAFWHWQENAEEFRENKAESIEDYVDAFRRMLIENFDDHEDNFED